MFRRLTKKLICLLLHDHEGPPAWVNEANDRAREAERAVDRTPGVYRLPVKW